MSQSPDELTIDPAELLPRLEARYQQQLQRSAEEIGRLVSEVATLETLVAKLLKERNGEDVQSDR